MRATALRTLTLITLGALAGCSDSKSITSPAAPTGPASSTLLLSSPATVDVVTRDVPLATSQSASAVIGFWGGRISLPGAGLSVWFPAFAVTSPTTITITAVAGRQVAYEFEPHGTQFNIPVFATQKLAGTSASSGGLLASTLYAGYFHSITDLDQLNATATVSELLGTSISAVTGSATFAISHFSGYLIAAGLTEGEGEGSQ